MNTIEPFNNKKNCKK